MVLHIRFLGGVGTCHVVLVENFLTLVKVGVLKNRVLVTLQ